MKQVQPLPRTETAEPPYATSSAALCPLKGCQFNLWGLETDSDSHFHKSSASAPWAQLRDLSGQSGESDAHPSVTDNCCGQKC